MPSSKYVEGKTADELRADLVGVAEVGSPVYEQIKAAHDAAVSRESAAPDRPWAAIAAVAGCVIAAAAVVALFL